MPIMTFVNFMRWRLQLNENNVLFVKKGNSVFGVRKGEGRSVSLAGRGVSRAVNGGARGT